PPRRAPPARPRWPRRPRPSSERRSGTRRPWPTCPAPGPSPRRWPPPGCGRCRPGVSPSPAPAAGAGGREGARQRVVSRSVAGPVPIAELLSICGPERTITDHAQLRTYEADGLLQSAVVPASAVLPDTAEQVAVVAACHRPRVACAARAAGTGLSGGSLPLEGGVRTSLSRMRRILDVDFDNQ